MKTKEQVGAVLTFPVGVSEKKIRKHLLELQMKLQLDEPSWAFESIQTGTFDPACGSPVFYVP